MSFPATFNIRYYKGDFYQFVIRPKTSTGDPFPISDTTHDAFFYISTSRGGNSVNTKTALAEITDGNVVATIVPSLGNQLGSPTTWYYDVSIRKKTNTNELYTVVTGTISVTSDITSPGS